MGAVFFFIIFISLLFFFFAFEIFCLDGALHKRRPLRFYFTEVFFIFSYLVRQILREPLRVLWRERKKSAVLAVEHTHNKQFLALADNDIFAKLFGYFVEIHNGLYVRY